MRICLPAVLLSFFLVTSAVGESWPLLMPTSDFEPSIPTLAEGFHSYRAVRCRIDLESLPVSEQLNELSVYRSFNSHVRAVAGLLGPEKRSLDELKSLALTDECLSEVPFEFSVFESGELREGNSNDLLPVHMWRRGNGYLVVYALRKYESRDGEGDAIAFCLVAFSASGSIVGALDEIASWYEYEGYIRVRDAKFVGDVLEVTETIFSPILFDDSGRVMSYDNGSAPQVIFSYVFKRGRYGVDEL